jgi:Family of unknown function (DUF5302)
MTNDAKDADQPANDPADPAGQPVAAASPSAEEVKRKFREALDRKHAHGGRDVSEGGEHAKIHDAHGPAKAQQMFRRKSGS